MTTIPISNNRVIRIEPNAHGNNNCIWFSIDTDGLVSGCHVTREDLMKICEGIGSVV